ncbi:hypothetical protein GN958_ATG22560 [Phytophthora infestans]|uniref:Uncharacterized protein n=1 Tax=Phytophthora infestans TaxID=4787 RepID=A0A8S9TNH9_PHYIN|nr:hypothetical protein GN958_ATG22560 [Phytophthora infestans]
MAYEYDICDIAGDENVYADLLSRWGSTLQKIRAIHLVPYEYSPTLNDDFQWPSTAEILQCQLSEPRSDGLALSPDNHAVLRVADGFRVGLVAATPAVYRGPLWSCRPKGYGYNAV